MSATDTKRRQTKGNRRAARQVMAQRQARQRRMLTWAGVAIAIALVAVAALIFLNRDEASAPPPAVSFENIPAEGRFLGDPEAPVDFVVYSDFQCPYCKQFDDNDLPKVIDTFVRKGDVRVEWRPMPIISNAVGVAADSPQNESMQSAEAAMCAGDQGKFWPYSEALFAAQGAENSGIFTPDMLKQTAADLDLDTKAFAKCLDSGEKEDDVLKLRQDGIDRGVKGTPTFLINDQLVSYTAQGFDKLEQQLNDALEGKPVGS